MSKLTDNIILGIMAGVVASWIIIFSKEYNKFIFNNSSIFTTILLNIVIMFIFILSILAFEDYKRKKTKKSRKKSLKKYILSLILFLISTGIIISVIKYLS